MTRRSDRTGASTLLVKGLVLELPKGTSGRRDGYRATSIWKDRRAISAPCRRKTKVAR